MKQFSVYIHEVSVVLGTLNGLHVYYSGSFLTIFLLQEPSPRENPNPPNCDQHPPVHRGRSSTRLQEQGSPLHLSHLKLRVRRWSSQCTRAHFSGPTVISGPRLLSLSLNICMWSDAFVRHCWGRWRWCLFSAFQLILYTITNMLNWNWTDSELRTFLCPLSFCLLPVLVQLGEVQTSSISGQAKMFKYILNRWLQT